MAAQDRADIYGIDDGDDLDRNHSEREMMKKEDLQADRYYWAQLRLDEEPHVVQVKIHSRGLYAGRFYARYAIGREENNLRGLWFGPIEPPEKEKFVVIDD